VPPLDRTTKERIEGKEKKRKKEKIGETDMDIWIRWIDGMDECTNNVIKHKLR
jgi:hypothetical protein